MDSSEIVDSLVLLLPVRGLVSPLDKLCDILRTLLRSQWLELVEIEKTDWLGWLFFRLSKVNLVHIIIFSVMELFDCKSKGHIIIVSIFDNFTIYKWTKN